MKKIVRLFLFLVIIKFAISGCSMTNEADFDRFSLEIVGLHGSEKEGSPYLYVINPKEANGEVILSTSEEVSFGVFNTVNEIYDLESTSVTDEEIIIEFNGESLTFKRLSQSVVEDKDKIQY